MLPALPELPVRRSRRATRLLRHHVPLFILAAFSVSALYATRPYSDVLSRASFATAYPALVLLAATLLVGPWNLLRGARTPVSNDLRRDLGIWAGTLGIVHTAVGQNVHLRGRPWLYYVYAAKEHHVFPMRHDLFGLANYTGVLAVLLLIALFVTSNDFSLRRLGALRWKGLQRWNYALLVLTAIHAFAYQGVEKQKFYFVATVCLCLLFVLAFQSIGIRLRRKVAADRPTP